MASPLMLRRARFAAEVAAREDTISSSSKLVSLDRLLGVTADGIFGLYDCQSGNCKPVSLDGIETRSAR